MALERIPPEQLMVELLDRVLDKGVVIDAAARISVVGIRLVEMDVRIVVASFQTYLQHADAEQAAVRAAQRRVLQVGQRPLASDVQQVEAEARRGGAKEEQTPRKQPPEPPVGSR